MASNTFDSNATLPSPRKFGLVIGSIFFLLAVAGLWQGAKPGFTLAVAAIGAFLLLAAAVSPGVLQPANRAWFWLGHTLGRIVSPIVLGVFFFLFLTPIARIAKAFGHDELRLKRMPVGSYWMTRDPSGPTADSFKDQY